MNNIQSLEIGTILQGKKEYIIKNVLGHGGCGILYYATSVVLDGNIKQIHEYAIKEYFDKDCCRRVAGGFVEVNDNSEEYKEIREEFRSEANCLKNLHHDNIVQVNEVFEQNGTFYYVMEYLKGITLRASVVEPLSEKDAINYIKDVAFALDYLHSQHINHLDVKPDNIMLVDDGTDKKRCVLIDFGLSKHFDKNGKSKGRQGYDGASDGYSPKEQYEGIDVFTPEADVYSLAATLFFLLTAKDPCSGKDMTGKYVYKNLPDEIDESTAQALINALNPDCSKRTDSIETFYSDLTGKPLHVKGGTKTKKFKKKKTDNKDHNSITDFISNKRMIFVLISILAIIIMVLVFPDSCRKKDVPPPPHIEVVDPQPEVIDNPTSTKPDVEHSSTDIPQKSPEEPSKPNSNNNQTSNSVSSPTSNNTSSSVDSSDKDKIKNKSLDLGYATWKGGVKNGKPDGVGIMTFRKAHKLDSETLAEPGDKFDGSFTDGQLDVGKLIRQNGETITIIGEN